eukprot:tig00021036_g17275.t1
MQQHPFNLERFAVAGSCHRGSEEDRKIAQWVRSHNDPNSNKLLELDTEGGLRIVIPPHLGDEDAVNYALTRLHHAFSKTAPITSREARGANVIHVDRLAREAQDPAEMNRRLDRLVDLPPGLSKDLARRIIQERLGEWQQAQRIPGQARGFRPACGLVSRPARIRTPRAVPRQLDILLPQPRQQPPQPQQQPQQQQQQQLVQEEAQRRDEDFRRRTAEAFASAPNPENVAPRRSPTQMMIDKSMERPKEMRRSPEQQQQPRRSPTQPQQAPSGSRAGAGGTTEETAPAWAD